MLTSVLIATYGGLEWEELAWSRAHPSVTDAHEILVFHDPEGTIASVRNELGARASGDWLCFLDADDELGPGYVQDMQRAYEQEGGGGIRVPDGTPLLLTPAVAYVRKNRRQRPIFHSEVPLDQANWLVVGTLVQRDLFLEVGGFSDYPHGFEDWSLWAKCWKAGAQVVKVPDAVYIAYINPQSKHRQGWRDRRWQVETHMRVQKELFPS